jgi:DNA-binding transcriptional LysR family regulator
MEIRQLEYFVMVGKGKSFAGAAKSAYISQQALSKAIHDFEKELGVPLFLRSSSGVQLTKYGDILLEKATHILAEIEKVKYELFAERTNDVEIIKCGFCTGLLRMILLDKIWDFKKAYKNTEITFIEASDKSCEQMVFDEKLDIGCLGARGGTSRCDYYLLQKSTTMLAVSINHPLAEKDNVRLEELADENFVLGTAEYNIHDQFQEACRRARFSPRISYQSADFELLKEMVRLNKGIFTFPDNSLNKIDTQDIKILNFVEELEIHGIYLITKKNRNLSNAVKLFRDYLIDKIHRQGLQK